MVKRSIPERIGSGMLAVAVSFLCLFWSCRPLRVAGDGAYGMTDQEIQYAADLAEKYGTKAFDILTGDTPANAGGHVAFELAHVLSDMAQSKEYENYFNEFFGVDYSGSIEGEYVVPRLWRIDDGTNIYNALGDFTVKSGSECKIKLNVYGHTEYNCLLLCTRATTNNNVGVSFDSTMASVNMYPRATYYIVVGSVYDGVRGGPSYKNGWLASSYTFGYDNWATLTPTKNSLTEYNSNGYGWFVTPPSGFFADSNSNSFYVGSPYFSAYTVGALNIYNPQQCIDDLISSLVTKYGQETVDSVYDYDIDFNHIPPTMDGFTFPGNLPGVTFPDVEIPETTLPETLWNSLAFYFQTFDQVATETGAKPVLIIFLIIALVCVMLKI